MCDAKLKDGKQCDRNEECIHGRCSNGKCRKKNSLGHDQVCDLKEDCKVGYSCIADIGVKGYFRNKCQKRPYKNGYQVSIRMISNPLYLGV
jgi:hypothetical protein